MAYTRGDGKIDHEQLSRDLSDAVIELNAQRRELLGVLKEIKAEAYGKQQWAFVVDRAGRMIDKIEKAIGVVPEQPKVTP